MKFKLASFMLLAICFSFVGLASAKEHIHEKEPEDSEPNSPFSSNQHSPWGARVSSLTMGAGGTLYVYMNNSNLVNPAGCSNSSRYVLPSNHDVYERLYSLILSAHVSKTEIRFNISGSSCAGSSPAILNARTRN